MRRGGLEIILTASIAHRQGSTCTHQENIRDFWVGVITCSITSDMQVRVNVRAISHVCMGVRTHTFTQTHAFTYTHFALTYIFAHTPASASAHAWPSPPPPPPPSRARAHTHTKVACGAVHDLRDSTPVCFQSATNDGVRDESPSGLEVSAVISRALFRGFSLGTPVSSSLPVNGVSQ